MLLYVDNLMVTLAPFTLALLFHLLCHSVVCVHYCLSMFPSQSKSIVLRVNKKKVNCADANDQKGFLKMSAYSSAFYIIIAMTLVDCLEVCHVCPSLIFNCLLYSTDLTILCV